MPILAKKVLFSGWYLQDSIFKRSWRARALLNISKTRNLSICYQRVSVSLSESQQVTVNIIESLSVLSSFSESLLTAAFCFLSARGGPERLNIGKKGNFIFSNLLFSSSICLRESLKSLSKPQ